ncbi:MAG: hypothetical protein Q9213_007073 [Squamulea squamosa]
MICEDEFLVDLDWLTPTVLLNQSLPGSPVSRHLDIPDSPPREKDSMEGKVVDNRPHKHKRPTLRIIIPSQQPIATSSNHAPQPASSNTAATTNGTTASDSHHSPPQQVPKEQDPPVLFREVDYSHGKTDPASSISSHSPLSDTLGQVAYTGHARALKKALLDCRSKEEEKAQGEDIDSVESGAKGWTENVDGKRKTEETELMRRVMKGDAKEHDHGDPEVRRQGKDEK